MKAKNRTFFSIFFVIFALLFSGWFRSQFHICDSDMLSSVRGAEYLMKKNDVIFLGSSELKRNVNTSWLNVKSVNLSMWGQDPVIFEKIIKQYESSFLKSKIIFISYHPELFSENAIFSRINWFDLFDSLNLIGLKTYQLIRIPLILKPFAYLREFPFIQSLFQSDILHSEIIKGQFSWSSPNLFYNTYVDHKSGYHNYGVSNEYQMKKWTLFARTVYNRYSIVSFIFKKKFFKEKNKNENIKALKRISDWCIDNNISLKFIVTPVAGARKRKKYTDYRQVLNQALGYSPEVWDFSNYKLYGLKKSRHFRTLAHLNIQGARIFNSVLSSKLLNYMESNSNE